MFNYDHFKDSGAKRNKSKDAPVGRVCLPVLQKRFVFSPFQLNCEHNVRATVSLTPINFSKTVHVRHRKVKTHTCGIYILSVLKLALLILSAVQHSKVVRGQSVAKVEEKENLILEIPHIAFHQQPASCVGLTEMEKVGFLWRTPVEESQAAAKQK